MIGGPVRYMGTKRALAPIVRTEIASLRPRGPVLDLFSGMGAVAAALAPRIPVVANDVLEFAGAIARARFMPRESAEPGEVADELFAAFAQRRASLRGLWSARIAEEARAIRGGRTTLDTWMRSAPHVGRSEDGLAPHQVPENCGLVTSYFSASYFSTVQAIDLDAIRYAIDRSPRDRDWLLGAWISAAASVVNAPGHTAQFLRPSTDKLHRRVVEAWRRDVWPRFTDRLFSVSLVGTHARRKRNQVLTLDALDLAKPETAVSAGVAYADPPYTKDHYSRFYHVYETMYRYDYPDSHGLGRYRSDRFVGTFGKASTVEDAFRGLSASIAARNIPLVLSYPAGGLLERTNVSTTLLLRQYFKTVRVRAIALEHSTMGSSDGSRAKDVTEKVYVCVP